jgi:hypothetical protein
VWPTATVSSFELDDDDDRATSIRAQRADPAAGADVSLSRVIRPAILRVRLDAAPTAVTRGGAAIAGAASRDAVLSSRSDAWFYDKAEHQLWVRLAAGTGAASISAR